MINPIGYMSAIALNQMKIVAHITMGLVTIAAMTTAFCVVSAAIILLGNLVVGSKGIGNLILECIMDSEMVKIADFSKVVRLGMGKDHDGRQFNTFVKIEFKDGKLSITGVEGPMANGNAKGSCGQIGGHRKEKLAEKLAVINPDLGAANLDKLDTIWAKWHLNDMQPACEHQRAENWGKEDLTIDKYKILSRVSQEQRQAKKEAMDRLLAGEPVKLADSVLELLSLQYWVSVPHDEKVPTMIEAHYELESSETKTSGWIKPSEHPKGVLCKPCPTCEYRYGSAWLKVEVPADVLEWLQSLPDTDRKPAWV